MRNPPDDGAVQRSTRRRDRNADPGAASDRTYPAGQNDRGRGDTGSRANSGSRGDSGRPGGSVVRGDRGGRPAAAGSVFAPGYDTSRSEPGDRAAGAARTGGSGVPRYGSAAGAAGKGPVRGYPPVPGQPPPMYPPGQFAAWNRGPAGRAQPGSTLPGPVGPDNGGPDRSRAPDGPLQARAAGQPPVAAAGAATSRYYAEDVGSAAEPGYPVLAVSDPAADVTSTQTWRAVGDGRATGIWTAPPRPGGAEAIPAAEPAGSPADPAWRPDDQPAALPRRQATTPGSRLDLRGPDGDAAGLPGDRPAGDRLATDASAGGRLAEDRPADATRRVARGHSGAHTSPHSVQRSRRADRARRTDSEQRTRRKRPASVKLAIGTALVLVLAAVAALSYGVLRNLANPKPKPAAGKLALSPSASASASPSLGPYGHIGSRTADPQPLTTAQLYPASFTIGGVTIVRTAASQSANCAAKVVGASIQSALGSAHCDQVDRATYLSSGQGLMGTIGVLNLATANGAKSAARSADASDFISQLHTKHGPTHKIGQGTGIEEAAAKGHYLILIWAEFTSLRKPRTAAQRAEVEQFMTALLQNTANVSLTTRMITGIP